MYMLETTSHPLNRRLLVITHRQTDELVVSVPGDGRRRCRDRRSPPPRDSRVGAESQGGRGYHASVPRRLLHVLAEVQDAQLYKLSHLRGVEDFLIRRVQEVPARSEHKCINYIVLHVKE